MRTFSLSAAAFADRMLSWYDENRRLLPWREDPTPYHVWLSEIMLQQTQVQTVIPYYTRFITELPQIADLAHVSEDRLHKLWEGLGYYSRADHLHEAAQILLAEHNGLLPESYSDLLALPGIGPYTAGAIASIAFGERVAAGWQRAAHPQPRHRLRRTDQCRVCRKTAKRAGCVPRSGAPPWRFQPIADGPRRHDLQRKRHASLYSLSAGSAL